MKSPKMFKELQIPFKWEFTSIVAGKENLLEIGNSDMLHSDRFYEYFQEFVVQALNEKWERTFGKSK